MTQSNVSTPALHYEQAVLQRQALDPEFMAVKDDWIEAMNAKDMPAARRLHPPVQKWLALTEQIKISQAELVAQASMDTCRHAYELLHRRPTAWTAADLKERRVTHPGGYMYLARVFLLPTAAVVGTALIQAGWLWAVLPLAVFAGRWQFGQMRDQVYADLAFEKACAGDLPDDAQRLRHELGLWNVSAVTFELALDLAKRFQAARMERLAAEKAAQAISRQAEAGARHYALAHIGAAATGVGLGEELAVAAAELAVATPASTPVFYAEGPLDQDLSASYDYDQFDDPFAWQPEPIDPYGAVNPASGLPMLGGGAPLDVGGNLFGTNDQF